MGILAWLVLGLIAGFLASMVMTGGGGACTLIAIPRAISGRRVAP